MSNTDARESRSLKRLVSLPAAGIAEVAFRIKRATSTPDKCINCIYWQGAREGQTSGCGKHISCVKWNWSCHTGIWKRKANKPELSDGSTKTNHNT